MKIVKEIFKCDICNAESECQSINYPVLFTSNQTDGSPCTPRIYQQRMDVCHDCLDKIVKVTGYGAHGFNTYKLIEEVQK